MKQSIAFMIYVGVFLFVGCEETSIEGVTTPPEYYLAEGDAGQDRVLYGATIANEWSGKVIGVTDGDTIKVLNDQNEQIKIRLEAIDTPERKQPFGTAAKEALSEMLNDHVLVLETGKDRYGRTLGFVEILPNCIGGGPSSNAIANAELIRLGYAWHYKEYNKDPELAKLEDEARHAKRGLWGGIGPDHQIPPWEWRRLAREASKAKQ